MPFRGHPRRLSRWASLRSAARRFRCGKRGTAALESALGITVLVVSLAMVMEIVSAAYTSDHMSRAARAAARSLALNPPNTQAEADATACDSIIRELNLPTGFVCNTEWRITIDTKLLPGDLPTTPDPNLDPISGSNGDMVFVRIGWERDALTPGDPPVPMISMGLARSEP